MVSIMTKTQERTTSFNRLTTNDFSDNPNEVSSTHYSEARAYSALPDEAISPALSGEFYSDVPLTDYEIIAMSDSFDESLAAYKRITATHIMKRAVTKVLPFSNAEHIPVVDATQALTVLEQIATRFNGNLSDKQQHLIEKNLMRQLRRVRHEPAELQSVATLERVAAATDILPTGMKPEGVDTFEEVLETIEFELPRLTGEHKLSESARKAAEQVIELYQKSPDPVSLKASFDSVASKNDAAEINSAIEEKDEAAISAIMTERNLDYDSARRAMIAEDEGTKQYIKLKNAIKEAEDRAKREASASQETARVSADDLFDDDDDFNEISDEEVAAIDRATKGL